MMKTIILTQDYEIFFGKESGTVNNCMIKPNQELMDILRRNNSTMTVFWDVLHYHTLKKHVKANPELQTDISLIEKQIQKLQKENNDIQLHIHSHWLDAKYTGNHKWSFTYDRYSLHDLEGKGDTDDINTINGCVTACTNIINEFCKDKERRLVFRAGGYHLEPFQKLINPFKQNLIYFDSSMVGFPGGVRKGIQSSYRFSKTPSIIDDSGSFTEFPITTIKIPLIRKIWFKYIKGKYGAMGKYGDGNSIAGSNNNDLSVINKFGLEKHNIGKRLLNFVKSQNELLTPEGSFIEKFRYIVSMSPDFSIMTLHPKNLNKHQIDMLSKLLEEKKVRFISIATYLKLLGNN